jgi:ATP-dependent Lon protease
MVTIGRIWLVVCATLSASMYAQEQLPIMVLVKDFIHSPGMLEEFGAPPGLNVRDMVELGIYPLGIIVKNNTDQTLVLSKESFALPPVNVELIAPQLHRHTTFTPSLAFDSFMVAATTGWIIGQLGVPVLLGNRWGQWSRLAVGGVSGLLYYARGCGRNTRITQWVQKVSDTQSREMSRVLLPHSQISMFLLLNRATYFGSFPLVFRTFPANDLYTMMRISLTEYDIDGLYMQLHNSKMPDEVKRELGREIDRLRDLSSGSHEAPMIRTYIDWVLSLPWSIYAQEPTNLAQVWEVLNTEHYGLEKAKERVLDILAMRIRNQAAPPPIICLVGPPGTGKTSLARAIATSLHRPFERISVGGVDDEATIRGHRRTYIGAIPGRFISAIKKAEVANPVILIDEIDKMGSRNSDAARAALLEILDHEQNSSFEDHYLGVPFDFSQVLFITTANTIQSIPEALIDRMEIIEVSSYTEQEKIAITRECLWPRSLKKVAIDPQALTIDAEVIQFIIRQYTLEAGIRELDRLITTICMKAARALLDNQALTHITREVVSEYLGPSRAPYDTVQKTDTVGVVNGLAAFAAGGIAFPVQVTLMSGTGQLKLTGKLGKMIEESANIAISYARAHAQQLHISDTLYNAVDIHIHMPAAALSKDGPSAGIAITAALVSACTQQKARCCFGMTGEIDLQGRVLPIGSLKEKVLAASRQGITHIIAPRANQVDFESFKDLVADMTFIWAESIDQVLDAVLIKPT